MELRIVNGTKSKSYMTTNAFSKPYLKVDGKIVPLTTSTKTGIQLKAKAGNVVYRAMDYESVSGSATFYSSNANGAGLSSTTALTSSNRVITGYDTRWCTYNTWYNTRLCTYQTIYDTVQRNYKTFTGKANAGTMTIKVHAWTRTSREIGNAYFFTFWGPTSMSAWRNNANLTVTSHTAIKTGIGRNGTQTQTGIYYYTVTTNTRYNARACTYQTNYDRRACTYNTRYKTNYVTTGYTGVSSSSGSTMTWN